MVQNVFIILWKDLLMRKNHYLATASEVLIPTIIILLANMTLPKYTHEVNNNPISFDAFTKEDCVLRHNHYEKVIFEPSTPFINKLMSKAACYAGYSKSGVKFGKVDKNNSYFSIGIKFEKAENVTEIPDNLIYTIYPTNEIWIQLNKLWRYSELTIPRYNIPSLYNVIEIQRAIDVSYMKLKNITAPEINLENTDFFERGPRVFSILIYMSLFLSFSLMVPPIISRVVQEKFTGAKELMLMMGVKEWELWMATFMNSFLFLMVSVSGMIFFLYFPIKENSNVLKISPLILWSIIMYGLAGVIIFLFFVSCFFEKSSLAVFFCEIIWCFSFVFNNFISVLVDLPAFIKFFMCLFPHVTLMNGISVLLDFDFYEKEIKFTERLSGKEDYLSLLGILLFMSINIVLYSLLTWYMEQVKPGKYGVPKPYGFYLEKSYWRNSKKDMLSNSICLSDCTPSDGFESAPANLRRGIAIQKVTKVYKALNKVAVTAVNDVSISFYHGEISALLGHNGAGKTTIFSMITGLTNPTSGRILINGYDLALNIREARRSLGLCPQKDMLFNDLTVLQILRFYGVIKGLNLKESEKEAMDLIKKLKLNDVKNTQTCNLSGGQKRKVSLAIALIGGSEVLILDEPTSGMDPEIRREIWEILLNLRGARTILLTTHFMEEADALCDRIAIMNHGKIKCYGTPMFLKSKYGKGYVLSVVINDVAKSSNITEHILQFIPNVKLKSQNIRTLSYELPESDIINFPPLLSSLDAKQKENEIISYSISLSSLEDVFLKLRNERNGTESLDETDSVPYVKYMNPEEINLEKVTGFKLYFYQFWALLIKKWILFRRNFKLFLLYSILSALLIVSSTLLSFNNHLTSKGVDPGRNKPIAYSTNLYSPLLLFYSNPGNQSMMKVFPEYIKSLNCDIRELPNVKEEIYKTYKNDFYEYSKKVNLAVEFSSDSINILHNDNAVHMVPVALNLMHNFMLKMHNINGSIVTSVNVELVRKDPLFKPRSVSKCTIEEIPDFSGGQTLFYFLAPLKEEIFGAKELQLMITPIAVYWFSHLLVDVISFTFFITTVFLWFGFLQENDFILNYADQVFVSLILWGIGMILLAYFVSTLVKDEAGAFTANVFIYVIFTFLFGNLISSLNLPKILQYLHPTCILKFGFSNLCSRSETHHVLGLFLYDAFLFGLLVAKDSKIITRISHGIINKYLTIKNVIQDDEDEVVKEEKYLVKSLIKKENSLGFALVVSDLKRWYLKSFKLSPAVRGISFAVKEGECFGLLGVNGAGKTSTFKMLTGSLLPSSGSSFIRSEKLSFFNRQKYLFQVGYCPQFGGIIPALSGKELLEMFGRLRGVHGSQLDQEVSIWLEKLELTDFSDQKCGNYSGGNQRKLSTAVSLIGNCPLIFLDEPTSGVDPASRRLIWNVIDKIQKRGQSVFLTSHSMDECEALCSRVAIMISGRFRCLGEITTLKKRFGQGYCVQLKVSCNASEDSLRSLKHSFASAFDHDCKLLDDHLTILQYHVTNQTISWADLFTKLKALKDSFKILESYTASETTLEQIFIYLARNQ